MPEASGWCAVTLPAHLPLILVYPALALTNPFRKGIIFGKGISLPYCLVIGGEAGVLSTEAGNNSG